MTTVSSLVVEIGSDITGLTRGVNSADKKIDEFSGKTQRKSVRTAAVVAGIGAALITVGVWAVDTAVQWETAFTGVEKTVEATDAQLNSLETQLRDMATDTSNPLSALDNAAVTLATIAEMGGSLGIAVDDIDEFTQTIGMLTMATDLSAESAAMMIGQFANITGMPAEDFDNFGATLVDLGNKMAATEPQILEFAQRIAAAGERANLSEPDILAFAAAMASVGLDPEAGGSAFTQFIDTVVQGVARGGPELQTLATTAGMTADAFREGWADDPAGMLVAFLEGLSQMSPADQLAALDALGLTGLRATDMMTRLAGASDMTATALDTSAKAWEENTALMTEAEKRAATSAGQMAALQNNVSELGIQLGTALIPVVNDAVSALTDLVSAVNTEGAAGAGDWLLTTVENLGDGINDLTGLGGGADIILPDVDTAVAGWQTFFDSVGVLIESGGRRLNEGFNTIAVGTRSFVRDIEELLSRAQVASADVSNLLGQGNAATDAARTAGIANINAIETAENLETQLREGIAASDVSIDVSNWVTTDPAVIASKIADPLLIQQALTAALGEGDTATFDILAPVAMELGIDALSIQSQYQTSLDAAAQAAQYAANITVNLTLSPGSVDASAVNAVISGAISGVGTSSAGGQAPIGGGVQAYATGTDYVPNDGLAYLHEGEGVLTKEENRDRSRGGNGNGGTTVVNIYAQSVDQILSELNRRGVKVAKA